MLYEQNEKNTSPITLVFFSVTCTNPLELVFLVDSSSKSSGSTAWNQMLYYVNYLIDRYVISSSFVRVAFIRYADTPSVSFYLTNNYDLTTAKTQVLNVQYTGGNSDLAAALNTAVNNVFTSSAVRSGVPKVIVIITDNLSSTSSYLIDRANNAKSAGITIVGVGINYNGRVNSDALIAVVSDYRYLIVSDYSQLSATATAVTQSVADTCILIRKYALCFSHHGSLRTSLLTLL